MSGFGSAVPPYPTWSNTMTKLLLILMVVGLWSGCGGDNPTEQIEQVVWFQETVETDGLALKLTNTDIE
jgi:hypothetical protein